MVYPVDSLGIANDSAFWAAYNTPNPLAFRGGRQSVDTTSTVPTSPSTNIVVEEKKNSRAGWVLGSLFTIGAAAFCIAAHKKGPEGAKFLQRIGEGAKTIIRNGRNRFIPEHPTVSKEGDKVVMRFAGEKNHLSLRGKDAAAEFGKIGETVPQEKLSELLEPAVDGATVRKFKTGNELTGFKYTAKNGDGEPLYRIVASGKTSGDHYKIIEVATNKDVTKTLATENKSAFDNIQTQISKFRNGEDLELLDEAFVRTTNSTTGLVTRSGYKGFDSTGELISATSDKFALESDKVQAYLCDHEGAKKVIDAVKDGKTKDLKVANAECVVPKLGTFKLDSSGNIVELKLESGRVVKPTDDLYKAEKQRYKTSHDGKSFEEVISDRSKWSKASYRL